MKTRVVLLTICLMPTVRQSYTHSLSLSLSHVNSEKMDGNGKKVILQVPAHVWY
jgi:hypothetical protein